MKLVTDDAWAIMTLWQEARGESPEGKRAVAEVIRNRMRRYYSSDGTVAGTVLWPYQFSGWNTTDHNRRACADLDSANPVVQECMEAWRLTGTVDYRPLLPPDTVLYCNLDVLPKPPKWAVADALVGRVGRHSFYRDPAASRPRTA